MQILQCRARGLNLLHEVYSMHVVYSGTASLKTSAPIVLIMTCPLIMLHAYTSLPSLPEHS